MELLTSRADERFELSHTPCCKSRRSRRLRIAQRFSAGSAAQQLGKVLVSGRLNKPDRFLLVFQSSASRTSGVISITIPALKALGYSHSVRFADGSKITFAAKLVAHTAHVSRK